jgi:hypothetical protein
MPSTSSANPASGIKKGSDPKTWPPHQAGAVARRAVGATPAPRAHGRVGPALPLAGGLRGGAADHRRLRAAARGRLTPVGRDGSRRDAADRGRLELPRGVADPSEFKSPPGAADNERKRLSLLPRTLRPPPARTFGGVSALRGVLQGPRPHAASLLPHGPTVARAFRPAPPRRWVSSLAERAGAAAVLRPALDRSQRPQAGAATQAAAEVAM